MTATATNKRIGYDPLPKQRIFHSCPADEVLFGGAAGPGKSRALLEHLVKNCLHVPGGRAVMFRRRFPDIRKMIDDSKLIVPESFAKYNENDHRWVFAPRLNPWEQGGPERQSVLQFSHMNNADDRFNHQGEEYDWIGFDESTHFTPDMVEFLRTRNRSTIPGSRAQMLYASNPGNIGHLFFSQQFVFPEQRDVELLSFWDERLTGPDDKQGWWARYPAGTRGTPEPFIVWRPNPTRDQVVANKRRESLGEDVLPVPTRCFIPGLLEDNPYLYHDGRYEARLLSNPNENQRRALRYGDWTVFEGQYFTTFDPDVHVIDPMSPPPHWRKWASMDWGSEAPLAYLWHTQDPETKQIITYRELYRTRMETPYACEIILDLTGDEHINYTAADPAMWNGYSREDSLSFAELFERNGVELIKAQNSRLPGWARCRDLLAINPLTGKPGWVLTRDCLNGIRTIPMQIHDENNIEDLDSSNEDHWCDAWRYGMMAKSAFLRNPRTSPMKHGVRR